jgi:hypothetical protein
MQLYDAGERTFDPKMYKAKSSKVPHTTIDALESWKKEFPNMEGTTDVDKSSRLWQYYGQPGERGLLKNLLAEISNAKNEETDLSGLDHTTLFRMGFNDADGNIIGKQPGEVNFKESHAYDNSVKLTIIGDKVHVFFRPDLSQVDFVGRRTWEDDTAINYMWDAVESLGKELNLPNNTELVNESSFKLPKKLSDIGYKQKGAEETPLTHLNVMLINGVPKQSDKRINHNREPYVFKTTEGDRIGENHIDSPVMVEQQLFDQILRDAGIHPDAGAAKGVIRFANEESGALLAKLLYVRAGDKESAEMREADVHMKLTDTAVKQSGERQAYDHFYDGVKMTYSQDKVSMEPEKYSLPLDAFTLNNGVYEDPVSFKKDQILVGQFLSNMTKLNVDEKVLGDYIKRIENENIQGDKAINNIVKRGVHDEMFDANGEFRYDIEDVSLDIISDIVGNKEVADSPMYRAIWRHIRRLENIDADEVDIDLGRKVLSELNLTETVTDRLLRLWEPTPATIHFPLNEQSNNAMLSKYLTRRILKPKVKHSGKAFMMPYDAYLQENIDLQPGEFWLNDGYKDKIVKVRGEKMTLENALKIKDLTDQEREMVLVRVPASSISGIRTLIFKGFTGRKGVGVLLHDKDMEALGGADLDGDSAFIYQDIDPALRSEIKKNENEWTDKNGKDKMVKNKTARKILDIQPMPGERLKAVHTFDPYSRLDIARKAYQGKKLVGVVNNMKKRLAVIESMLNEKGELDVLFSNFLKEGGKPSPFAGIRIKFFPERQMGYREMLHNMVNFAVDSAKENGLPDPFVLMEKIYDKTLEASYIDKDGHIVQDAKLSDTIMGYLQHFDKTVTNGYDYKNGKLYTLQEKIDAAKDLVDYIDKNNLDKSSPVYNQAKSVASLTYDGRIESWLNIEAAKNLLNSMNKIFKNQSQLPEVERLKDLVFREIYPTFKKSAEAENDFYNEIVGLASVKEIFKESQKILSKVEDPDGVALELRKIAEKTDYFKRTINKLVTAGQEDPSVYTTKNKVLEKVNAELVKYKDSLPEEYKAFFDQYFIGAIFSQTKLPTGGDVQLYSYGIDHPAVSDASIARLGRSLNKLVRQVNEGKSDKFIESLVGSDALKKINNPELKKAVKTTKEFEQPVVARTKAATVVKTGLFNTRKRMELVKTEKEIKALKKKLTSVDLASELTAEGMKLSADMTEILQRHPEIEKDFDAIFAGVTGLRTAEGSMKHGIHPKAATLEDIRDFVDFYKHYKQSDKPVGLNRLTFWMFPSYARDRLSKVDLQYFNISKYPVKMPNGVIKNINVRYPMSSIGRDMKYSDGISSFTDQHTDRRGKMLVKEFSFLDNYGVKGEDLVDIAMSIYEKDTGAGKTGKNFKLYNEYYENAMKKLDTEFKDEKFELLEGNKKTLLSAKQVVDRIIKRHHALNKEFYSTWVRLKDENGEFVDEWADYRDKRGNIILDKALKRVAFPIYEGVKNREVTLNALMELGHETILNYMEVTGKNGKSVLALNLPKAEYLAHMKRYKRLYSYRPIGEQENHFPHNGHPRHIQEAYRKNRLEEMEKRGASKAEITQANMEMLSKQMDSEMYDMNLVHPFQTLIMDGKVNEKALEIIGLSRRIGHAQSRDTKNGPMPEWNKSVSAINFYQQQIIKGYANILHALGTHRNIHNFESKQLAGKETTNWARYMKLRLMTDIGYPSVIPQEWLSDPTFKVKGTPFNFLVIRQWNKRC